jgi:hypothetical protein
VISSVQGDTEINFLAKRDIEELCSLEEQNFAPVALASPTGKFQTDLSEVSCPESEAVLKYAGCDLS